MCGVLVAVFLAACATLAPPPASSKEARAVWLSRFDYCGVSPTHDPDSIQAYITQVVRQAARANFNILFFQVRGSGDAYYQPGLEPWGSLLTGTLGADPGWDPLQFAIEAAQAHGLELHAWVNVYPAWKGTRPPGSNSAGAVGGSSGMGGGRLHRTTSGLIGWLHHLLSGNSPGAGTHTGRVGGYRRPL
ncbi:MAG: family 10 glycosylhydrolase [Candidatus Marinimicrobia bacterium]|nr:family 10 glycosylhydrolase [Candidatus Neomarinimicrobiota bacterium]